MKVFVTFYIDAFRIAVKSILEHKLRAFLTLLGVIIGVAAVIVVSAAVSGLQTYVGTKIESMLGANHFMMNRMASSGEMDDAEFERRNKRNRKITWDEYEYIKEKCSYCAEVGAQDMDRSDISQNGIEMPSVQIQGVTDEMELIEEKEMEAGRFILQSEVEKSRRVCVIGADVAKKFFPNTNPIGKTLKVEGMPLRVVGVEETRGSFFGQALDRMIYIPISVHFQLYGNSGGIQVHGSAENREMLDLAIEEAVTLLRNKRKLIGSDENTFGVVNTKTLAGQVEQFTGMIRAVVVPIAALILVVGGIVVMNIMLVSVTERTFEVGLRKAIGATRRQILLQFLIESAILCAIGGLIGLALAMGVTTLVTALLEIPMSVTPLEVFIALSVSSVVGIIAGIYPAAKASKLDPIVALTRN